MKQVVQRVRTIDLGHDQMLILDDGRGDHVRVLHGGAWLTGEDDAADRFLRVGDEAVLGRGRALLQALAPTRLQWRAGAGASGVAAMLRHARAAARRVVARLHFGPAAAQPGA